MGSMNEKEKIEYNKMLKETSKSLSSDAVLADVRPLLKFVDWILANKIPLCDKRCLMKDIETDVGNVKSNRCERESCPDLVLKLLADNVRAHFS